MVNYWLAKQEPSGPRGYNFEQLKKEKTKFGITLYTNADTNEDFESRDIERNDPVLVKVVEELGSKSFGFAANLKIVEIPDDVNWEVVQYDGLEHIAEKHRTWY